MRSGNSFQPGSCGRWNGRIKNGKGSVGFLPQHRLQVIDDTFSWYKLPESAPNFFESVFSHLVPSTRSSAILHHSRRLLRTASFILQPRFLMQLSYDSLATGTPRQPTCRPTMETRPPVDTSTSVGDTEPEMDFDSRYLTFRRSYTTF